MFLAVDSLESSWKDFSIGRIIRLYSIVAVLALFSSNFHKPNFEAAHVQNCANCAVSLQNLSETCLIFVKLPSEKSNIISIGVLIVSGYVYISSGTVTWFYSLCNFDATFKVLRAWLVWSLADKFIMYHCCNITTMDVPLGVIQELRKQNFAHFWPPTYLPLVNKYSK